MQTSRCELIVQIPLQGELTSATGFCVSSEEGFVEDISWIPEAIGIASAQRCRSYLGHGLDLGAACPMPRQKMACSRAGLLTYGSNDPAPSHVMTQWIVVQKSRRIQQRSCVGFTPTSLFILRWRTPALGSIEPATPARHRPRNQWIGSSKALE
jgi:hypothetical protein